MAKVLLRNATDTFITGVVPTANRGLNHRLWLSEKAGDQLRPMIYFTRPWPNGAEITKATLHLRAASNWPNRDIQVNAFRVTEKWGINRVNWNTRPSHTGPACTTVVGNGNWQDQIDIDVTPIVQAVANGSRWYGILLLSPGNDTPVAIHSGQSERGEYRPQLEIEWKENPEEPDGLSPAGGNQVTYGYPTLTWTFSDLFGDENLSAVRVQMGETEENVNAGITTWDSGEVPSSRPELDLSEPIGEIIPGDLVATNLNPNPQMLEENGVVAGYSGGSAALSPMYGRLAVDPLGPGPSYADVDSTPLEAGKTYTIIGTVTTPTAQSNVYAGARSIAVWYKIGTEPFVATYSPAGPEQGSGEVRLTVAIPAEATSVLDIRLMNGSTVAGEVVLWDDVLVVEGEYDGDYFDGDTVDENGFMHEWQPDGTSIKSTYTSPNFPGLTNGEQVWWRVANMDGAGLWSPWSDAVQFGRTDPGVLLMSVPPALPNNFIWEGSPTVEWFLSGTTQRAFQVILSKTDDPQRWLWNNGKITLPDTSIDIPFGEIDDPDDEYRITLRVWDDVPRVATPGDPVYMEFIRDVTVKFDPAVAPVTNLSAASDPVLPMMHLRWTRATVPDTFQLLRSTDDGETWEYRDEVIAAEAVDPDGGFEWYDSDASTYVAYQWKVVAVENKRQSADNPVVNGKVRRLAPFLMRPGGKDAVCFLNPDRSRERLAVQELHNRMSGPPVLVTQNIGGQGGNVSGRFVDGFPEGVTARMMRNRFLRLERDSGQRLKLCIANETLTVVAYNFQIETLTDNEGITYEASFDWIEV